jgi:hypothetical protein
VPLSAQSQPIDELLAQARTSFRPVTQDDVLLAVSKVRDGLRAVESYTGTEGQIAASWRSYLDWERQAERLDQNGGPDAGYWMRIYRRVTRNQGGLEHSSFEQYRKAVRELSLVMAAANSPDQSREFEATLDQLAVLIQSPHEMSEADHADQVSLLLDDLARQQQVGELIGALRQQYSHPNVVIKLPAKVLEPTRSEPIETDFPVNDYIGGAAVRGTGHLSATRAFSFVPNDSRLEMRISITGVSHSTTTGTKDQVTVRTAGEFPFTSEAEVVFDRRGFSLAPFRTRGQLKTRITGISSGYRRRARANVARREVYARRESDRREAQRNAITDLNTLLDEELGSTIADLQNDYRQRFYRPLQRLDRAPQTMQCRSEANAATIEMLFADSTQLGVRQPADLSADSEWLRCLIHQSAINNFATVLSGRTEALDVALRRFLTVGESAAGQQVDQNVDQQADQQAEQEPDTVWMTFADQRPLRAECHDDEVTLTLSGKAYTYRKQRYSGMDIILRYRLTASEAKPELVLSESPEVALPKGPDGRRRSGGVRTITLRRILANVLQRDVPKSINLDRLSFSQRLNLQSDFSVEHIKINDGWLTLDVRPLEPLE